MQPIVRGFGKRKEKERERENDEMCTAMATASTKRISTEKQDGEYGTERKRSRQK